ncbi:cytochrome c oxidase assembly protein [Erythrobacteraceae bacterium CFH 75059]|uniref:cytochrome c oxidase assembly protein n=1 Tax=Qipengyuania thermophila TaxID=2509361 RepID=UPI001022741C|nr:cytochrome c oxidase assembly protein [Qipengyuania thermophila]TCD04942.1 cytochrome c oxidase assembly protein [Erythrobacteraceae bacterium CFH 75059]
MEASRNLRTGLLAGGIALAMLALGFAAVPLYRIFCQVTGFGGTTQIASEADAVLAERFARSAGTRPISIRFDASTARDLPWSFRPVQITDRVQIGERDLAFYTARNDGDRPITGVASFNVSPASTGKYFHKVQCFCFTEQTLQPGEEVRMPVLFYVDPAILDDENARNVEQITLSYTFHEALEPAAGTSGPAAGGALRSQQAS